MSKWYGKVGFTEPVEFAPGTYESKITERPYYGDVISDRWKRQNSGRVNDDINLSNQISIVADLYAMDKYATIAYVEYMGTSWKVTDVEVQFHRLILTVGGVWNGS